MVKRVHISSLSDKIIYINYNWKVKEGACSCILLNLLSYVILRLFVKFSVCLIYSYANQHSIKSECDECNAYI